MPTEILADGTEVTWTGKNISFCTHCRELFNSGDAFDHHLKRDGKQGDARHDISGMPRNRKGYLVVSLRDSDDSDAVEKFGREHSR